MEFYLEEFISIYDNIICIKIYENLHANRVPAGKNLIDWI